MTTKLLCYGGVVDLSWVKKVLIGLAVITLIIITATGITAKVLLGHEQVVQGVNVGPLDLSGLSRAETVKALRKLEKEIDAREVRLEVGSEHWNVPLKALGVKLNTAQMATAAYAMGRQGTLLEQYQKRQEIANKGQEIKLDISVDQKALDVKIADLTKHLTKAPINATFRVSEDDQVEFLPGKNGEGVDVSGAAQELDKILEQKAEPRLVLTLIEVEPQKKVADLEAMGIKAVVSKFTTIFDASQGNRSYNIAVAAEALNGLLVEPNQIVSFNEIVGPRSSEAGYREAPEIVNNKLVPGIGGGVCQVSTTLYNSLLKGNYEIINRRPHSIPASYVPVGRDATVTYGGIDFKFKNNRNSYLYIKSSIKGNRLVFKLFGDPNENKEVVIIDDIELVIENKTIFENDPNLEQGKEVVKEKGHKGFRTTTVRLVKESNRVVKREVVAKSFYKPINRVIALGTGELGVVRSVPNPETPIVPEQPMPE
ncbi:MAG: VanW family protein [Carboxydocellales bacterium]